MSFKNNRYVVRKMSTKHKILLTALTVVCLISISSVAMAAKPTANFKANTVSGVMPLKVTFSDLSTGNPTSWLWNFGDGVTSSIRNASHTYQKAGIYTVKLTVKNSFGSNTATKTNYITLKTPDAIPIVIFTVNKTSGTAPLTVKFTDQSTNNPTSVRWYFGDGTDSSTRNATHTYTKPGMYNVKLVASNSAGSGSQLKTYFINVEDVTSHKPIANFNAIDTTGKAPYKVYFSDLSSGNPTSWYWDFGDGTTSSIQNAGHTFTKAGKYTVSLTVKNAAGSNTAKKTSYITVTK